MMRKPIYLDYSATTPCDERVVKEMLPYFSESFGNASSVDHAYGWTAQEAVDQARERVASLIGAKPYEVFFTSGATESVNLALKGICEGNAVSTKHIITSQVEHKAVLETCAYLEGQGVDVTYLPVDNQGLPALEALEQAIRADTICLAFMYVNNETGVLNPVKEIAALAKKYGICFFCDATQAVGKLPIRVGEEGIDLLAFSGHKIYGPKGVGALYRRASTFFPLEKQQHGGTQEHGLRSGTLNVPAIVGFGMAARCCEEELLEESLRSCRLRDRLEQRLKEALPDMRINGGKAPRVGTISNLLFPGIDAEQLLLSISGKLALSRGSACSGLVQKPSHVLLGMGVKREEALASVRISLGRYTREEDLVLATEILIQAVQTFLKEEPSWQ